MDTTITWVQMFQNIYYNVWPHEITVYEWTHQYPRLLHFLCWKFHDMQDFDLIAFEFKTRLLLAQFGFTIRPFLGNFVAVHNFYSNILNSKQSFVGRVWFCSKPLLPASTLSCKCFKFGTKLLLVEFGFTARLLFTTLVSMQDFCSNILNSKQSISWHSLVSKQDFSWEIWFHIKTLIENFWIRNKTFVGGHTRLLLVELGLAARPCFEFKICEWKYF